MKKPIVEYNPKLPELSKIELKVLSLLREAGKLIVPIYELQENHKFPGANFYPHDVTAEEIRKSALKNPDILSPYTVVERKAGKLIATPYHEKYAHLLKPIAKILFEAVQITDNKEFAKALKIQAQALVDGSYDKAAITWMGIPPYILDINIGPIERYDDKLLFTKTSYQAWVGVMDKTGTKQLTKYKEIILNSRRKALIPSERVDYFDKIQTRVDDLLLLTGFVSRKLFSGINLPNDPNLIEKYGSEVTLFKQTNRLRHDQNMIILNKLFSPQFRRQFNSNELEEGSLYVVALHELAHSYLRYRNAEQRLQDLFPIIDELGATVMGIKVCGSLLLKDIITQKQIESIMLAALLRGFYDVLDEDEILAQDQYSIGWAIFINYLRESGALKVSGKISWPNFMKMFVSVDQLANIIERLLSIGTRKDSELFIKKFGSLNEIKKFK